MKEKCPNCGEMVTIKGNGRRRSPIHFKNVSEVLNWHTRGYWVGQPHFLNTSKEIYRLFGVKVSAGLVQDRLHEEARIRGITYQELVKRLAAQEEFKDRQEHILVKMREG